MLRRFVSQQRWFQNSGRLDIASRQLGWIGQPMQLEFSAKA